MRRGIGLRSAGAGSVAAVMVVIAVVLVAVAGWTLAGAPGRSTALPLPLPCPLPSPAVGVPRVPPAGALRPQADRLLVPIGPLAARVCRYRTGDAGPIPPGAGLLLDPTRTATLAGDLDEPLIDQTSLPITVRATVAPAPRCAQTTAPVTLVRFAFRSGPDVTVAIGPATCPFASNGTLTTVTRAGVPGRP